MLNQEEGVQKWNDFHNWVNTPPQAAQDRRPRPRSVETASTSAGAVYDAQASVQAMMAARERASET